MQVKLEYKLKKNEALIYNSTIQTKNEFIQGENKQTQDSIAEMAMEQLTKGVTPDGIATVDVTIKSGSLKINDKTEDLPNVGQVITMDMRKNGDIIKTSIQVPFTQPTLPEKNIAQGESWTGESKITLPERAEPVIIKYNYTLKEFQNVSGYECAVISLESPETKIKLNENIIQTLSAKGATYFAHKEGRLIKSEVITNAIISAPDLSIKTTSKINLDLKNVKSGAVDANEGYIIK